MEQRQNGPPAHSAADLALRVLAVKGDTVTVSDKGVRVIAPETA